ncbi:putative bifunctional diguanylate cyclase/phosphodiesterase [Amphritea pacifica]|uniref:EAL domain-containing protein n=1 Tax=Amphritea pacifica TaxID=2811233 RepID=A0ABS2W2K7_9GAMM|nr:EAL domain-containing protein [Amphritea pacifica]MBN0985939.1 EAL domain-containing protein [Amphritea pacifica]
MIHSTKSSDELRSVRNSRYILLCKLLLVIGTSFLLVFGSLTVVDHMYLLGAILLGCMSLGYVALYQLHRHDNIRFGIIAINSICVVLSLTLLITGGRENTGIFWVYPLLAINIFINRFRTAVLLYGCFLIICGVLLLTPFSGLLLASYSSTESIRIEFTLAALYLICLATLHSDERAQAMLIKMHDADMHKMAFFDTLTGLPNRWNIKDRLESLLHNTKGPDRHVGLLYIDLDNFKKVNDHYGHDTGDQLLSTFSARLRQLAEELIPSFQLELGRMAGDEFVVVVNGPQLIDRTRVVAERILQLFEEGLPVQGISHSVYASIGIALYPEHAETASELIHRADLAMYQAKGNGRNRFEYYSDALAGELRDQDRIESALRVALKHNFFSLVFMPMYDCQTLEIVGLEVLLRAENLQHDGIGPDRFIPIAEKTRLIKEIDLWVISNAMARLVELQTATGFSGKLCINISGIELHNELFPAQVKTLLNTYGVVPSSIEFEITETAFVVDDNKSRTILSELRALGISLALDDFGTGFTAFRQLINYPADCLKIDRSFVNDLFSANVARHKMVRIIEELAELYELRVVAEGVETQEQLDYLQQIGCDWVQGYFLSRPLSWPEMLSLMSNPDSVVK